MGDVEIPRGEQGYRISGGKANWEDEARSLGSRFLSLVPEVSTLATGQTGLSEATLSESPDGWAWPELSLGARTLGGGQGAEAQRGHGGCLSTRRSGGGTAATHTHKVEGRIRQGNRHPLASWVSKKKTLGGGLTAGIGQPPATPRWRLQGASLDFRRACDVTRDAGSQTRFRRKCGLWAAAGGGAPGWSSCSGRRSRLGSLALSEGVVGSEG